MAVCYIMCRGQRMTGRSNAPVPASGIDPRDQSKVTRVSSKLSRVIPMPTVLCFKGEQFVIGSRKNISSHALGSCLTLFLEFYVYKCFVCVHHMCDQCLPTGARFLVPWNWTSRQL